MRHSVTSSLQPAKHLSLQGIGIIKGSAVEKIILYKLHYIFYFAFALGICLTAKVYPEGLFKNIAFKILCKQQISQVLLYQKQPVLIINYFFGDTFKKLERLFMGINGSTGRKRNC